MKKRAVKLHSVLGKTPSGRARGFALVVTISLMVLLTLVAVGLLGLSSVALRSSSSEMLTQAARQNARLALALAIGELQASTGPDRRVTASATTVAEKPARGPITGVWEGWKWDGSGTTPDFRDEKSKRFLRWLVSSHENGETESQDFATQSPSGNQATLVSGATAAEDRVTSLVVPISTGAKNVSQGMAWAVFDESAKLPTQLPEFPSGGLDRTHQQLAAAPLPGYAAATARNWKPIGVLKGERLKLVTPSQSELSGLAPEDCRFHDLTSRTAGIAVDVSKGGLAVDMSRLFDSPSSLPVEYSDRYLYSGTNTPLAPVPNRFRGANPFPAPDPSWKLLRSHYRMFDKISNRTRPEIGTSTMERPPAGSTGRAVEKNPFFHEQQVVPVISKAQFVFSLSFGYHNSINSVTPSNYSTLPEGQKDQYVTWLVIDPVITLWNPYNVTLRYTGGRIDLHRIPLAFRLYKNGRLINSEYTHMANTFVTGDMGTRMDSFYRLNLLPEKGKSEIRLAPGEHVVLTASNHAKHYNHEYRTKGLDLRPGFSPPAGNASVATVGGTSTLNVCVSSTGDASGSDYGKAVRTVAVKPNDVIQLDVKPLRAQVDRPAETGGKEISGFLKYYAGSPDSPRLVGGLEFDYAGKEASQLRSFSKDDLPALVVSAAIPRNLKADDYQGANPPPVVRFKEPFLISTFQLKTERDSKFPSRGWIENSPVNLYASAGLDQTEPWTAHQNEFQWEVMTDWPPASPTIEISNSGNRGYGGPGIYAQSGLEFATHSSLPLAPYLSIPQLRHAPLNAGGQLPLVSQVVANSFVPPQMDSSTVRSTVGQRILLDHSYHANSALFDGHFFSGVTRSGGPLSSTTKDARSRLREFFDGGVPLPNTRFIANKGGRSTDEIVDLLTQEDGYRKTAAHILIDCPFNINSTRVDVWQSILASAMGVDVPVINSGSLSSSSGGEVAVLRHLPSPGADFESQKDPLSKDRAKWNGHRMLTSGQVRRLAEEIVVDIRKRGPFLSLAEFINRRPGNDDLAAAGAVQSALERADVNAPVVDGAFNLRIKGNTADGCPGILTQADILTPIAPILTARGDTFRIRAYGEAGSANGAKTKVWCEAVVQRMPQYLDSSEEPWVDPQLPANKRFGRRYQVIDFRWLSPSEI